jgi:4-amino-4-deoxy-L-arabinose transferase-like glycosyltransferase
MKVFSTAQKKLLWICAAIIFVTRVILAFRPESQICTRPYTEDSFYVFSCAQHLSHGDGFSVDGVQPTNGVQPLIVVLYAPIFDLCGANKWLALRLSFLLGALIGIASMYLLARLLLIMSNAPPVTTTLRTGLRTAPILGALLWTLSYPIIRETMNGLETGLYSMLILAACLTYAEFSVRNETKLLAWAAFGVTLGSLVLARIDGVFFVMAFGLLEIVQHRWEGLKRAIVLGVIAFVVSLPWWIYNLRVFGSLMPTSGQSESIANTIPENLSRGIMVIADIVSTFFYMPSYELSALLSAVWVFVVFGVILAIFTRFSLWKSVCTRANIGILAPLGIASFALVIFYIFFFSAPHFLPRYFQPLRILWLILFALACAIGFAKYSSFTQRAKLLTQFAGGVVLLAAITFSVSRYAESFNERNTTDLFYAGKWALQHQDGLVGMNQSGTASFIAPNVINLDGKVNRDALEAKKAGTMGVYLVRKNFRYLADWKEFVDPLVRSAEANGAQFHEIDSIGLIHFYERVDPP